MKRWDIINRISTARGYKDYLEIGQQKGQCFREIRIENKEGVDPKPKDKLGVACKYHMTSDDFFKHEVGDKVYDMVFIDGLHIREQVLKDVQNSLKHLRPNGTIVLHDCNPPTERHQVTSDNPIDRTHRRACRGPIQHGEWNGDVWKAFLDLRTTRDDIQMYTVDTDCGCGVIQFGKQDLYVDELESNNGLYTWSYFEKNRKSILNLLSTEDFLAQNQY
tara:strand:- start:7682 stop:8338 length:657 start_codon:yes stop_codon:yes gene_type:complete